METDKVPGPDGFNVNFYITFWAEHKHTLHSVFIRAVETNTMPASIREGTICLMEKINKNPLKVFNWRPLSMLDTSYKIYAKVQANRLQMVLPYLISHDQTGFMKNHYVSRNLTELLTVIDYWHINNIQGIVTSVDFEKAFDTVSWTAMERILFAFNFGDTFVKNVMLCYRDFNVNIGNNGHFTQTLQIERGNKQGCPLSALMFLLVIEVISLKLKQDDVIEPITIEGIEKLLAQYADDLWTVTKLSEPSFFIKHPLDEKIGGTLSSLSYPR